jgi:hypothetical protein
MGAGDCRVAHGYRLRRLAPKDSDLLIKEGELGIIKSFAPSEALGASYILTLCLWLNKFRNNREGGCGCLLW